MKKRKSRILTVCLLSAALAGSMAGSSMVYAAETDLQGQTGRALLEMDETAVMVDESAETDTSVENTDAEQEEVQTENAAPEPSPEEEENSQQETKGPEITPNVEQQKLIRNAKASAAPRASAVNISSADQLIDFATRVNNGETSLSAELTKNIDMSGKQWQPIGKWAQKYSGSFNGNGFVIENITFSGEYDVGLFGTIYNATISNLGITGNFSGIQNLGSIVGYVTGDNNSIQNCWSTVNITATDPSNTSSGGIVGNSAEGKCNIANCIYMGKLQGIGDSGAICGVDGIITNSYYINTVPNISGGGISKSSEQFASGEVTWLLNGESSTGVWKQTIGTDKYPTFTGGTVYKNADGTFSNTPKTNAPTPTISITKTASSITVNSTNHQNAYGAVQYKWDNGSWGTANTLSNLGANSSHTVAVRYMGQGNYMQSQEKQETISTNQADYTITIPATTLAAGNADSKNTISVNGNHAFELGYNGYVDVKVKKDPSITGGKLKLTRLNDSTNQTITSALLVNERAFTDISKPIVTFRSKNDGGVSISFAEPEETNIPAGDYKGTITFEAAYNEQ